MCISPETDGASAELEGGKDIDDLMQNELGQNYESADFYPGLPGGEIDRLIEKGFAVRYGSWEAVLAHFGGALVSKLACIVKQRVDGSLKVRNVLDLRRSGYNSHVALAEREVLPRMKDLVDDAVEMAKNLQHGEAIYGMIADFEDALPHPDRGAERVEVSDRAPPGEGLRVDTGRFCVEAPVAVSCRGGCQSQVRHSGGQDNRTSLEWCRCAERMDGT